MSNDRSIDDQRQELAAAFGRDIDPLAEYEPTFAETDIDPFQMFIDDVLLQDDLAEKTLRKYRRAFRQWCEHMENEGRHPVCPTEAHVRAYAASRRELGNQGDTIRSRLLRMNRAYEYWQNDPAFPHPHDYNPIQAALSKLNLSTDNRKEPPRIPLEELADIIQEVTHIRDRAVIVFQLKLGLRAGEVANVRLEDLQLANSELRSFYPELGTHEMLHDRENAVYIPSNRQREGNKSGRPRVLPLDDETRRVLIRYLLVRPTIDNPGVFLSKKQHNPLRNEGVNDIWVSTFQPAYEETDEYRAVTSHFARHRFTTYWKVEENLNRELVKYMRGDITSNGALETRGAIDEYLHTYYEDIEEIYRERIYRFNL